jgi:hypothetical protein
MRAGEQKAVFFERLRLWNAMRFCDLPPVFTVLYGQIDERRMDPREVFARAWDAFDIERTERRTLRLSPHDGAADVVAFVRKMFAGNVAFTKTNPILIEQ